MKVASKLHDTKIIFEHLPPLKDCLVMGQFYIFFPPHNLKKKSGWIGVACL